MIERRKFRRLDVSRIEVTWKKEPSPPAVSLSKDISAGGIRLILDSNDVLKEGDFIHLDFKLLNGERISAKGRVAWNEEFEIVDREEKSLEAGIEFVEISDEARGHIAQFIFSALPQNKTIS